MKWLKALNVDSVIVWTTFLALIAEVSLSYVTSYQHIYLLDLRVGQHGTDARTTPIDIDLAILVFALVNLFLARNGYTIKWLKRTLWLTVLGTVAANAAYGMWGGYTGAAIAGGTALLLALTVEAGMTMLRVAAEVREKQRKETEAEEDRKAAQEAAERARNSERGKKAAATRAARHGAPEALEGVAAAVAIEAPREDPFPTVAVPALTGIGVVNGSR